MRLLRGSIQFSCSVMSDSYWTQGLQHTRLPCPSPTPGAWSNSFIKSVTLSNHLILCHPLLLLPSVLPSIRVFSSESALHVRWPKYWSFSFNISPSSEHSGLISFKIDWFFINESTKYIWTYFWTLYFVPFIRVSVSMSIFDCYRFVV